MKLSDDPHRRLNPLTNEWVLVSPHRSARPWQGEVAKPSSTPEPDYDPTCYLCPGNPRAQGVRNPAYTHTFVFDNDFAALKPSVPKFRLDEDNKGLIVAESESGSCRVLCFSPHHNLTLSTMGESEVKSVVVTWIDQFRELGAQKDIRHVQIFENRGAVMGASNPHPHCQIWATSTIPEVPAKELVGQRSYFEAHRKCLLCEYVALEDRQRVRVICGNESFLAVVPFWAIWPFEVLVCSRRHFGTLLELTPREIGDLSKILKQITSTYDKVFDAPFPYSMGFHQTPTDDNPHPEWHFHAHFYPPLLRSATIRKYMVGFEMLGTPQRDITAESAAARLQSLLAT